MHQDQLILQCIDNHRVSQKILYDKYKTAMYTLAYRMSGDFASADDILQEAFIKIFRGLKSLKDHRTLPGWIKTIVVRTAYAHLEKEKRKNLGGVDISDVEFKLTTADSDVEYIEKAISKLPDGFRAVFILVEIEGYAHKEVAEMLGISEGTSKSQLSRAKQKLREMLIAV